MFRLLLRAIRYNLSAQTANLPNLLAASFGMIINNLLFLLGIWGMLFAGKTENQPVFAYFIALNCVICIAWGGINFFCGGWIDLGELIVSGQLESKLATPRSPILLVATHALHPSALGDLLLGVMGLFLLPQLADWGFALRTLLASILSIFAIFGLYLFSGSLAFFVPRGNTVATLVREVTLSFSSYPVGKVLNQGWGRWLLLLSPAAAVSTLPLEWVEKAGWPSFIMGALAVIGLVALGLISFHYGLKRYQTLSVIGAQS